MKLLIVDDSALMRRQLGALFGEAGGFQLAYARNGREALAANLEFEPDVVTLDINMPEMDGLSALAQMMLERPVPVIMLSSLTEKGALATFEALNLGAVDYVAKPGGTISLGLDAIRAPLLEKVRGAARARVRRSLPAPAKRPAASVQPQAPAIQAPVRSAPATRPGAAGASAAGIVLFGVSTGGPRTLERILPELPADFPWPVVVAQHMPANFTAPFAARMGGLCRLRVVEASRPMPLEAGTIYICKGGADVTVASRAGVPTLLAKPENDAYLWHPSVELLSRSALEHYAAHDIVAVMLTGMGHDGADAFADIARRGGRTIAESEASAVVFGMPAELIRRGGAQQVLAAEHIAARLVEWLGTRPQPKQGN
ncbi:chemotaxis-specific protein-glutamate methyltransferase CheB [Massilia sp. BSC265]|uniref:chemotaxis-specific protein-glutamate methyltransferase CheB n=1 Tax=Massilia sp. BSC265 TaxID=1549812 RepID=UPI0004E8E0BD|nr:chemotaxis-specific protein-glutamate methyltransferase CheB [Massilia sp. BSC265]KFI08405.1 chemotaxis protein CheY [Massilia sp. BSC265]